MATYNDDKDYTSKGVGNAGLTLGIIGTTLASGLLNGNGETAATKSTATVTTVKL